MKDATASSKIISN